MDAGSSFTVRRAGVSDSGAIAPLFYAYRQFYDYASDSQLAEEYIRSRLSRDESTVFVAADNAGAAVGFTQLYPTFCSVDAGPIYVLYDLFVALTWRSRGVGRALLRSAEEFGRANGAIRLELSTGRRNRTAQSVYESLGWKRDDEFFHYALQL